MLIITKIGISFRIDSDLKDEFEKFCDSVGISMTTAVHLFIKTTVREQRIPFEIKASSKK
ncbi:type II toxin-antitoxin system RelB/DinJ family antitoxin [uncultured Megasphaera sp.]|uniref:type II toxin-antitoxin system RelB/DinJ family antitoxin n=1 Tax=uncultured Megasphaera sp. TaxID=165188 RepID=UPI002583ED8F|nr:type II toxin-antitoxin system RelB/DinJ family antitoxin [uncultured Megasphaera sp.]